MKFFLVAATLVASLVSAASLPQAAGGPLRQATRAQVVRRAQGKGIWRRQSQPSGGVYPLCVGSGPRVTNPGFNDVYAVIEDVELVLPADTNQLNSVRANDALDCALLCSTTGATATTAACAASQFNDSPVSPNPNCVLYDNYESALTNNDATSAYNGFTCSGIQAAFQSGDLTCCDYYA